MHWISTKFVPWLLTDKHKQQHLFVCQKLLDEVQNDQNFLLMAITGDKTWVCCYDPETKQHSFQWKNPSSPHSKKAM
jgi:hypothetical protein